MNYVLFNNYYMNGMPGYWVGFGTGNSLRWIPLYGSAFYKF